MAEGFLKSFDDELEVFSAGTDPAPKVHPFAVRVMQEEGIDISENYPKNVAEFVDSDFDFVITVCGKAEETCPVFTGIVKEKLHIGFEDPADAEGSEEEILNEFRRIRKLIKKDLYNFYSKKLNFKNIVKK